MGWFQKIPVAFQAIMVLIAGVGMIVFLSSLNLGNPSKGLENAEKTTQYMVDNAVPDEFNLIVWGSSKLQNHPYILLVFILTILWLFGYFVPKK